MRNIKILTALIIIITSTLSAKADYTLTHGLGPCIKYDNSIGWHIDLNFDLSSCTSVAQMGIWVYHGGITYGPINPITQNSSTAKFQIPSPLIPIMNSNDCVYIAYDISCNGNPIIEPSKENRELKCPCPDAQMPKDECIAQFEYKINTQTFPNQNGVPYISFNDNEYPAIGSFLPSLTNDFDCVLFPWDPTPPQGATFQPKYEVKDVWTFDQGLLNPGGILPQKDFSNYTHPNFYDNTLISHKSFIYPLPYLNPVTVCHRKTVTLSCGPYWQDLSEQGATNPPGKVVYDCKICHEICANEINTTDVQTIYTSIDELGTDEPRGKSSKNNETNIINSNININDIRISPNPASNEISIGFTSTANQNMIVKIVDMTGKVIQQNQINVVKDNNISKLEISDVSNGNYILTIENEEGYSHKEKITILK